MSAVRDLTLHTTDGTVLAARLFTPVGTAAAKHGSVLLAGALGVRQSFYAPFSTWLAARGWQVLTFDLRGMGASRSVVHKRSLRGLKADMLTWARQDFAAAVKALAERSPNGQVRLLGHSLGLHHAGMTTAEAQDRISMALAVGSGSGYWRDWAPRSQHRAPLMLHVAVPVLTTLLGWFPGARLGMVGDLPGPAVRQWSRWCRHPEFAWGAEPEQVLPSLQRASFPIQALSFTDDEAMTEACTRKLLAAFAGAPSRVQVVSPQDVGLPRIGHLGAFRAQAETHLWPLMEALLRNPN